jgi:hypothetical protein
MDTNDEKLLFRDEVFQIVGCAIEVLNTLGHGIVEKPYENALIVELGLRKIPFRATACVRRSLQGPESRRVHPGPHRFRFYRCGHESN